MGEIACDLLLRALETGADPPRVVYILDVPLLADRTRIAVDGPEVVRV